MDCNSLRPISCIDWAVEKSATTSCRSTQILRTFALPRTAATAAVMGFICPCFVLDFVELAGHLFRSLCRITGCDGLELANALENRFNMRRGFSASLLKRPNVDAARLLDCAPIEILLIIMSCRSSALAAVRLKTSSNLVGCSTGRLLGLAPRRILST